MESLCTSWEFTRHCTDSFLRGEGAIGDFSCSSDPDSIIRSVRLPHNIADIPLQYADSSSYEAISGYRRLVTVNKQPGMRYLIRFDGAAHIAEVFVNGGRIAEHRCGYTAFSVDITDHINIDSTCLVAVRLDSTENPSVPPFGFVIDYLTYGGLYRPVWLDERPEVSIVDTYVTTPDLSTVYIEAWITDAPDLDNYTCSADITDMDGNITYSSAFLRFDRDLAADSTYFNAGSAPRELKTGLAPQPGLVRMSAIIAVAPLHPWSCDDPYLYTALFTLHRKADADTVVPDYSSSMRFGVRTAEFKADGFYLNGIRTFIRGLNRHQNYPYIGYAAPKSLQRLDALILKNELHVNAVRTSHYPQSQDFLDACDELGLLVFTEIPGWQHIGESREWREQAVTNTHEMVVQYRNHPSIILWGVRINESVDCDELYTETNRVARALDPCRATSGVRYLENSHLLEDVYSFNDFSYAGTHIYDAPSRKYSAAKSKRRIMKNNRDKALLISECNGHMFPTKPWDTWLRREEHALRHARVLNDSMADSDHVGCFEWCMFDYPTHKDFGSGDRVCYHGVMDAFRNPKLAASVWAMQSDAEPVLEVSSSMDIGDYDAGRLERCYVFTNADKVRLYKNDDFVTELAPSDYTALPHGPLCVDDTIGCLLNTKEGFTGRKEKLLHKALVAAARYGIAGLPPADLLRMGWCMIRYGLTFADGVALFGKYVGNWGGESVVWRFDGIRDDKVIASVKRSPSARLHLEVTVGDEVYTPGHPAIILREGDTYDMSLVRVRLMDEYNSPAVYATVPVRFTLAGTGNTPLPLEIAGPESASLQGGATGSLVRTTGTAGTCSLTVSCSLAEPVTVNFAAD